jgi:hypothetical protein
MDLTLQILDGIPRYLVRRLAMMHQTFGLTRELLGRLVQACRVQVVDGNAQMMHPAFDFLARRPFAIRLFASLENFAQFRDSRLDFAKLARNAFDSLGHLACLLFSAGSLQFSQLTPQVASDFHQLFSFSHHPVEDFLRAFSDFLFPSRPLAVTKLLQFPLHIMGRFHRHFQLMTQVGHIIVAHPAQFLLQHLTAFHQFVAFAFQRVQQMLAALGLFALGLFTFFRPFALFLPFAFSATLPLLIAFSFGLPFTFFVLLVW